MHTLSLSDCFDFSLPLHNVKTGGFLHERKLQPQPQLCWWADRKSSDNYAGFLWSVGDVNCDLDCEETAVTYSTVTAVLV